MSRRAPLVAALVGAGLVVLVVAGLILPKASAVRSKQKAVETARQQETTLGLRLQQLRDDQSHAGLFNHQLQTLKTEVPAISDLPGIIKLLNATADQAGVDFMSLAPGQPTAAAGGELSTIPVQVIINGRYFAVDEFLYRLETLSRVVTVGTITLGGEAGSDASSTSTSSSVSTTGGLGANELQVTLSTNFYTTDLSAGPGSIPGPTGADQLPEASSAAAPTTGPSPTPSPTGSSGTSGG